MHKLYAIFCWSCHIHDMWKISAKKRQRMHWKEVHTIQYPLLVQYYLLNTLVLYTRQKLHNSLKIQSTTTSKVHAAISFGDENFVHA